MPRAFRPNYFFIFIHNPQKSAQSVVTFYDKQTQFKIQPNLRSSFIYNN